MLHGHSGVLSRSLACKENNYFSLPHLSRKSTKGVLRFDWATTSGCPAVIGPLGIGREAWPGVQTERKASFFFTNCKKTALGENSVLLRGMHI